MNAHASTTTAAADPVAAFTSEDPALQVIARWDAAHAALPHYSKDLSFEESLAPQARFDRAVAGLGKIERELARTPPTTAEGAAAALKFLLRAYGGDLDAVFDAPKVVKHVVKFLEREAPR